MTKKLNITAIANELEEPAFFPSNKKLVVSPTHLPIVEELKPPEVIEPPTKAKTYLPERANAVETPSLKRKRIITRNSFEIYEDQMDSLRKLSYQEKMEDKLGSMSNMVRQAIDNYLLKKIPK